MRLELALVVLTACPALLRAEPPDRLVVCDDVKDPMTLDPHKELSERNHTLLQQVYEGLVRFDPDGRFEPLLAVSWERIDPLRMRFHLRDKVLFHNGEPFDAEAVRFSVERLLDPKTGFPGIGFFGTLARAEVVDPLTVDLVTKVPDGILLNRVAWNIPIVPPSYVRQAGDEKFAQEPIGTGPFRFLRWEKGKEIVLEANRDYWMEGYPKARELVFRFIPESGQLKALFNGSVDLLTSIPGTRTLEVQKNPGTEVSKGTAFFTPFAVLNVSTRPFSDIRVRKAVNLAVEREALIRYDLLGNGKLIAALSMPGEAGHDPDLQPYPYDPKKAKELLKEAGYPDGFTVDAIINAVDAERTAKIIVADLAKIGIRIKQTSVTHSELMGRIRNSRFHMAFGGAPDPMVHSYFIQSIVLYSKSPYNLGANPEYDAMLEKMASTIDDEKRESLARELDRYIYDQALGIFTYQRIQTHAVRKGLKFTHYVTGMPHFFSTYYEKKDDKARRN